MELMGKYYQEILANLESIMNLEEDSMRQAAEAIASHIEADNIFYVYGPGAHSNLATQEVFFRAGGLMHVSAILDEGTLLSSGALRSSAMERMPGYGRVVLENYNLKKGDLLIIVNAYGMNAATIDAALYAKEIGVKTIGICSFDHANQTPKDHPARHPSKQNLQEIVDIKIDSKIKLGDAVIDIEGQEQKVGAVSTFTNAFILNNIIIEVTRLLAKRNVQLPIWKSGNTAGGDEWNKQFISDFKGKIKNL